MLVDVVLLPRELKPDDLAERAVVIFDVLRATTSMAAALSAGVERVMLFPSAEAVRAAKALNPSSGTLLCGEERCQRPADFDLGNSPGAFTPELHARKTLLMSTTNGTRAILAAKGAAVRLTGALVNAAATAKCLRELAMDITLLCAGTDGDIAAEDMVGAGAVIDALQALGSNVSMRSDRALASHALFKHCLSNSGQSLLGLLRATRGGQNVIGAGLEADIEFAARPSVLQVVGKVVQLAGDAPPFVVRAGLKD